MKKKSLLIGALSMALACIASPNAVASLVGDSIDSCLGNFTQCSIPVTGSLPWTSPGSVITDPGDEYSRLLGPETLFADFTASTLTIGRDATGGAGFAGLEWTFSGLDCNGSCTISNVTPTGSTGLLVLNSLTFGADWIQIRSDGFSGGAGLHSPSFAISTVPVPAAFWLFSSALPELIGMCDRILVMHRGERRPFGAVFSCA